MQCVKTWNPFILRVAVTGRKEGRRKGRLISTKGSRSEVGWRGEERRGEDWLGEGSEEGCQDQARVQYGIIGGGGEVVGVRTLLPNKMT